MNLTKLEQFVLLAQVQNMTRAAELLHVSESALSKSISSLEKELGVQLFDREKKRVVLNPCGKLAVTYSQEILQRSGEMRIALESMNRVKSIVRVGAVMYALYIPLATAYNEAFRSSQLTFQRCNEFDCARLLLENAVDATITAAPIQEENILCTHLIHCRPYYHVPEQSPVFGRPSARLRDLSGGKCYMMTETLTNSNIFYSSPHEHNIMMDRMRHLGIGVDYVDLNSMRLLFGSPDHFFLSDTISMLVLPELRMQDSRRFVYSEDRPEADYYLSVRKNANSATRSFFQWITGPDSPLYTELSALERWLKREDAPEKPDAYKD